MCLMEGTLSASAHSMCLKGRRSNAKALDKSKVSCSRPKAALLSTFELVELACTKLVESRARRVCVLSEGDTVMPVQTFLATGLAAHVVLELQPRFRPDLAPIRQQTFSRHYTAVDERSRMQVLLPRLWWIQAKPQASSTASATRLSQSCPAFPSTTLFEP